jgi:hypothetical protein
VPGLLEDLFEVWCPCLDLYASLLFLMQAFQVLAGRAAADTVPFAWGNPGAAVLIVQIWRSDV